MKTRFYFSAIALLFSIALIAQTKQDKPSVLMVLSSHQELGDTGKDTGYYLSEVTHAYEVFEANNYEITLVSPEGGNPPVDGFDLKDEVNNKYWNDATFQNKLQNTLKVSKVKAKDYDAIYYAGGHGTMWDFPNNKKLAKIAAKIYENDGIVAAVCHGPSALVNIKLSNGNYLVEGKTVSVFTNEEEANVKLENVVPFLLEDKFIERGATVDKATMWQEKVSVDKRLVTGQNPASAKLAAEKIVELLEDKH
ncbi:putative intracellular protease/amidase [Mesoflavibacter sabulilitoris]|uniref:Type 1 glutamine amidotransferase domain-containing protein n=1 Tax=Mesoflavibacter zeaxanthinifaciens subsp. sabulilitoris TaxID=1520893 RepID=A0A2T1NPR5_9FLAO|nr:type 1 glutamine amidotransferase domain-containing protein [Mesoflavibacter zeaxanthinifaciens]MBB3125190.1 putative intracellular protease/amidase [Mesoflavibacter zeaxanthinifaciens subsp. sabulilitoris]PSG94859.1 type 1 glutamine amidotransferase domain-containing protein [Mesoflavibacter zeaxanthinifaciens subsp. sabulilitoris]